MRYRNLGTEGSAAIAQAADHLVQTMQANQDANGELVAKLTATVDGVALSPQVFKISQLGLTKIQRLVHQAAGGLLDKTERHANDKHARARKHP